VKFKSRKKSEYGAALIEGALGFSVILTLVFGSLLLCLFIYQKFTYHHALKNAAFWISTGNTLPGLSREESLREKIKEESLKFFILSDSFSLVVCPIDNAACSGVNFPGNGSYYIVGFTADSVFNNIFGSTTANVLMKDLVS
jgi:hypothetical protein